MSSAQGLTGPNFGSYPPHDVTWLLKDLSDTELEMSLQDRDRTLREGGHYSEYLPQEYQPSQEYFATYENALKNNSMAVAEATATVSERVLSERGGSPVLVSLARAGTPVAILMKRWYALKHNLDVAHYAVSIVRDKGIDANALRYILDRHNADDIMFVDGWTGKGTIAKELQKSVDEFNTFYGTNISSDMAVLADPANSVSIFGTRADFLIPSACLNSTVSGLVSRTVLRDDLIGPEDFHGAKFYNELADHDVSNDFIDSIVSTFATLDIPVVDSTDVAPNWSGWDSLQNINKEFDVDDMNLNKPGIGETTRSLLRRIPWKILVNTNNTEDISHIVTLARERKIPLVDYDLAGLPYNCVSIMKPDDTRKGE